MWIVSLKRLREFWAEHERAQIPLRSWYTQPGARIIQNKHQSLWQGYPDDPGRRAATLILASRVMREYTHNPGTTLFS